MLVDEIRERTIQKVRLKEIEEFIQSKINDSEFNDNIDNYINYYMPEILKLIEISADNGLNYCYINDSQIKGLGLLRYKLAKEGFEVIMFNDGCEKLLVRW